MLILGFNGGPDLVHENLFDITPIGVHDSACVLIEDGEVVFGIEEERLNRIKHTNKFPSGSIRACLNAKGIELADVDLFAYYTTKQGLDFYSKGLFLRKLDEPILLDGPGLIERVMGRALDQAVDRNKLRFVHHHYAHAVSAYGPSGFDAALIVTIDGLGEASSGMALLADGLRLTQLSDFPASKSLGLFYIDVINYLGFKPFDEYKVMGLAPYGDPTRLRSLFAKFYTLRSNGDYDLHKERLFSLFDIVQPRRRGEPITQTHKDIAAALQESLEEIVFHVVSHYRDATKQRNLCLAGGVAHNCTLNGRLLRSGLFEKVFVQPASHDAGAALGAALYAYYQARPTAARIPPLTHVYWGSDIGDCQTILSKLVRWDRFISVERSNHIHDDAARLLAEGAVIGWVQGRSEFGPRALGNRSILADPRPAENKTRINAMVKKRESFRPFAPSVLEEYVDEYFEVPPSHRALPFMIFVVPTKADKRELLGAVTHVDGTARVQTVSREVNESFWQLIDTFRTLTGVPVLLNTSFNNNAEPIVDSVDDAVVCYLTTQLDYLIVGDYLIRKKEHGWQDYLALTPMLPAQATLHEIKKGGASGLPPILHSLRDTCDPQFELPVAPNIHAILHRADGRNTMGELLSEAGIAEEDSAREIALELADMWSRRLIVLQPSA